MGVCGCVCVCVCVVSDNQSIKLVCRNATMISQSHNIVQRTFGHLIFLIIQAFIAN